MPTDARTAAFRALLNAEQMGAFLNLTLDACLKDMPNISSKDRALATELTYGVARNLRLLDVTIGSKSSRPPEKLDAEVRTALRLGAYQLLFTRTKVHAAVNETVELVKSLPGGQRARGFVNALMRSLSLLEGPVVPEDAPPAAQMAIRYSQPTWLVERWIGRFGEEGARALCQAENEVPPIDVRIDPSRLSRASFVQALEGSGISARPTEISPVGLTLFQAGGIADVPLHSDGLFQVQDEAAQLVGLLARVEPGMNILDACAAPGGKTFHLAERLKGRGRIEAVDLYAHRLERLKAEAHRLGFDGLVSTLAADASRPLPWPRASFDIVLADLPCTGLGTTRRHPEIRARRTKDDPARMAELQREILKNLADYVRPGGQLIYAVCSMEPEEGTEQVPFIESLGFDLTPPDDSLGVIWPLSASCPPAIATFPHVHGCDGFFGARFVRRPQPV